MAVGFIIGDGVLKGRRERNSWPYLCLLALACGGLGALGFSYYTGVTESWRRPAFTFLGGAVAASLALVLTCGVARLNTASVLDAGALGICAGHALGRLGCFFGGCCFGRMVNLAPVLDWNFRFPSALVESGIELATYFYLRRSASDPAKSPGMVAARWMILYGTARFGLEYARGDARGALPIGVWGASPSQAVSLVLVGVGVIWLRHICSSVGTPTDTKGSLWNAKHAERK